MERAATAFAAYLRGEGLRLTRQRLAILDAILTAREHFTAEDLEGRLRRSGARGAKATIYRTLSVLVEGGFLEAHDFGGGPTFYEPIVDRAHHDHMVCVGCGRITEFSCAKIEALQEEQARRHAFTPVTHSLKIFGLCRACSKRRAPTEAPRRLPAPAHPVPAATPTGRISDR